MHFGSTDWVRLCSHGELPFWTRTALRVDVSYCVYTVNDAAWRSAFKVLARVLKRHHVLTVACVMNWFKLISSDSIWTSEVQISSDWRSRVESPYYVFFGKISASVSKTFTEQVLAVEDPLNFLLKTICCQYFLNTRSCNLVNGGMAWHSSSSLYFHHGGLGSIPTHPCWFSRSFKFLLHLKSNWGGGTVLEVLADFGNNSCFDHVCL